MTPMTISIKRALRIALIMIITPPLTLITSTTVSATGAAATVDYSRAQIGDPLMIHQVDPCPYVEDTNWHHIRAIFTDSTNTVIGSSAGAGYSGTYHDIGTYAYGAGGDWNTAIFVIPDGAALGVATIEVVCTEPANNENGFNVVQTYDPIEVTIVEQTTDIAVNETHLWGTGHFESAASCPDEGSVEIKIYSQSFGTNYTDAVFNLSMTDTIPTDSSGYWEYSVDFLPSNGFQEYMYMPWSWTPYLEPNQHYSLRARCIGEGMDYNYDSYLFELLHDEYVALGDSYSSGMGSFNYNLSYGYCARSTDSYAYYLVDELSLGLPNFQACSGAMTDSLYNGNPGDRQLGYLTPDTRVVTLTIGGNDAGFESVLQKCADYTFHTGFGCASDSAMTSEVADRIGKLAGYGSATAPGGRQIHSYVDILTDITTSAPNAKVYISGYPRMFGDNPSYWNSDPGAPGTFKCAVYSGTFTFVNVSYNDAMWMNDRIDDINNVIEDAVIELNDPNVTYVAPSTFDGHGLCDSGSPYLNGVIRGGSTGSAQPESFHPNVTGMSAGYGAAFVNEIG